MRKRLFFVILALMLLLTGGCAQPPPAPAYPLSQEALEEALAACGLSWTIDPQEAADPSQSVFLLYEDKKMVGLVSSAETEAGRSLRLSFLDPTTTLTTHPDAEPIPAPPGMAESRRPIPLAGSEGVFDLAASLYGELTGKTLRKAFEKGPLYDSPWGGQGNQWSGEVSGVYAVVQIYPDQGAGDHLRTIQLASGQEFMDSFMTPHGQARPEEAAQGGTE